MLLVPPQVLGDGRGRGPIVSPLGSFHDKLLNAPLIISSKPERKNTRMEFFATARQGAHPGPGKSWLL
jgi:hypothetical protein